VLFGDNEDKRIKLGMTADPNTILIVPLNFYEQWTGGFQVLRQKHSPWPKTGALRITNIQMYLSLVSSVYTKFRKTLLSSRS
jgi:hypothetical protein